ncbi:MAG: metal-sensing transcriptional repressor [Clostridiales bacterium]|nr:metal-sensing transcriptional repressor [Clostridiales bacterium]
MQSDKVKATRLLKTAKGQIEGLLKMVEEDRYCIDISNQILATEAILRKVNREILHGHIEHCVKEAVENNDAEKKLEEILQIMDKLTK